MSSIKLEIFQPLFLQVNSLPFFLYILFMGLPQCICWSTLAPTGLLGSVHFSSISSLHCPVFSLTGVSSACLNLPLDLPLVKSSFKSLQLSAPSFFLISFQAFCLFVSSSILFIYHFLNFLCIFISSLSIFKIFLKVLCNISTITSLSGTDTVDLFFPLNKPNFPSNCGNQIFPLFQHLLFYVIVFVYFCFLKRILVVCLCA